MTATMDVHEHGPTNKERVFVDARIRAFGDAWQAKNPLAQFFMQVCLSFHNQFLSYHVMQISRMPSV